MIRELIEKNRSYRKFHEDAEVTQETLRSLVNLARLSGCGMNMQSLRYMLVTERAEREKVYPNIRWAAFLKDWGGPKEGQRPSAFILMLKDKGRNSFVVQTDMGIACQSILLGAVEKGLGGCIIGALDKEKLIDAFGIKEDLELQYVIAIGKPDQSVILDEIDLGGDTKYWMDEDGNHHVPKIRLEDIIIKK
ncbi:MAG: nitroreductase [Firmicutes bacterium]|nr:nitroreductase [Bacillota bacterium]